MANLCLLTIFQIDGKRVLSPKILRRFFLHLPLLFVHLLFGTMVEWPPETNWNVMRCDENREKEEGEKSQLMSHLVSVLSVIYAKCTGSWKLIDKQKQNENKGAIRSKCVQ